MENFPAGKELKEYLSNKTRKCCLLQILGGALTGADPGFLESGYICLKVWEVCFADLI